MRATMHNVDRIFQALQLVAAVGTDGIRSVEVLFCRCGRRARRRRGRPTCADAGAVLGAL